VKIKAQMFNGTYLCRYFMAHAESWRYLLTCVYCTVKGISNTVLASGQADVLDR